MFSTQVSSNPTGSPDQWHRISQAQCTWLFYMLLCFERFTQVPCESQKSVVYSSHLQRLANLNQITIISMHQDYPMEKYKDFQTIVHTSFK